MKRMMDMNNKNAWKTYTEEDINGLERLNASYRKFLSDCKTERECTKEIIRRAEEAGYIDLDTCINEGKTIKNGDKLYAVNMNKSVALFNIGKRPISEGMNIIGAHIDSPRLDVKQNPLYEEGGMAYLDTHYYGGIKKYQWAALPLAIHGVIVKKDGTCVEVCVGEEDDDPVFCITDLLIHLSSKQMEKTGAKVIEGEQLDVVVGSIPLSDSEKNCVKENVLNILKKEYDIEEEDFVSAELEVVPAGKARELGFDNINMDIIAGLPGENLDDFKYTLSEIAKLDPDNLTVHTLAVKRASRLNTEGNAWGGMDREGLDKEGAEEVLRMTELGSVRSAI